MVMLFICIKDSCQGADVINSFEKNKLEYQPLSNIIVLLIS